MAPHGQRSMQAPQFRQYEMDEAILNYIREKYNH
jgi:hypothetical protein